MIQKNLLSKVQKIQLQSWHVKFTSLKKNGPISDQKVFYIIFSCLVNSQGFKKIAEVTGFLFQKTSEKEWSKTSLKETFDWSELRIIESQQLQMGSCSLSELSVIGKLENSFKSLKWDFRLASLSPTPSFINENSTFDYSGSMNLMIKKDLKWDEEKIEGRLL